MLAHCCRHLTAKLCPRRVPMCLAGQQQASSPPGAYVPANAASPSSPTFDGDQPSISDSLRPNRAECSLDGQIAGSASEASLMSSGMEDVWDDRRPTEYCIIIQVRNFLVYMTRIQLANARSSSHRIEPIDWHPSLAFSVWYKWFAMGGFSLTDIRATNVLTFVERTNLSSSKTN